MTPAAVNHGGPVSAPQFTPGPWQAETAYEREPRFGVFIPNEPIAPICRVKSAADARLIAAAPELYEALIDALAVHGGSYSWGDKAKAALAKARGETA